jgi:hypothetical protein
MSEEPRDYQLTHFNINPEVYAPSESRGRLGLALRAIRVLLVEAAQPLQPIQPASVPQS